MRARNVLMTIAAGAAIASAAGYAAKEMGMVNARTLKRQAGRAARAMENMTSKIS